MYKPHRTSLRLRFTFFSFLFSIVLALLPSAASAVVNTFNCGSGRYTVTDGVAEVDANAGCTGALVLDSSVTSVAPRGFARYDGTLLRSNINLTSVTIPSSVTTIGERAFQANTSMAALTFNANSSLATIGDFAFSGASALTSITLPGSLITIGNNAFSQINGITTITIPNSVVTLGDYAFYGCPQLTSVNIGSGVTSIGSRSFRDSPITSIQFPSGNAQYSSTRGILFKGNTLVFFSAGETATSYTIPSNITEIAPFAFSQFGDMSQSTISSITLPPNLLTIGEGAFERSKLTSISLPNSLTSIGVDAFNGNDSLQSIAIGNGLRDFPVSAFRAVDFSAILTIDPTNPYIGYFDGVLYSDSRSKLIKYPSNRAGSSFVIPGTVTSISNSAFYNPLNLRSLTIPNSVIDIDDNSFSSETITTLTIAPTPLALGSRYSGIGNLQSVTFSGSPTEIPADIFTYSSSLTTVSIPNSVTAIGNNAFRSTGLTSITLPNALVSIGENAFRRTTLTSIVLPNTVVTIGANAFLSSDLTTFNLPAGARFIGNNAFASLNDLTTIDYCGSFFTTDNFFDDFGVDFTVSISCITPTSNNQNQGNSQPEIFIPEPIQKSTFSAVAPLIIESDTVRVITLFGSFPDKIITIAINGKSLAEGRWLQSATSVVITIPASTVGSVSLQIYNGTVPVLPEQSIAIPVALTKTPTVKPLEPVQETIPPVPTVSPTPTPKPTSSAPAKTPIKATTITIKCVKGKTVKSIKGVKPKCPKGFAKK